MQTQLKESMSVPSSLLPMTRSAQRASFWQGSPLQPPPIAPTSLPLKT